MQLLLHIYLVCFKVSNSSYSSLTVQQGAFLSVVQRKEELWLAGCLSDMFPTQHNTTSPMGGPWRSCSPSSAALRAVQLELDEGWLSGERHAGPSLGLALCCCALQLAKRQTVSPGCQHLPQRPYHLPEARGGSSLPSQTSCRAPDVDLSSRAEAENSAKTQSESPSAGTFISHTYVFYLRGVITGRVKMQLTDVAACKKSQISYPYEIQVDAANFH